MSNSTSFLISDNNDTDNNDTDNNDTDNNDTDSKTDSTSFLTTDSDSINDCCSTDKKDKKSKFFAQPPAWFIFLKTFILSLLIIIPIIIVNANIIYFLNVEENIINKWFPSDCKKYPFGNGIINSCENMEKEVCIPMRGGSGETYGTLDKLFIGPQNPTEPAFPYKYYSKKYKDVIVNYFSWLIRALAKSNVNINHAISSLLTNETLRKCPSAVLLFLGSIILLLLPFVFGYSVIGNIFNQVTGFMDTGLVTKLVIFITVITGGVFMLNLMLGFTSMASLFAKLVFGPILVDRERVLRGIAKERHIIAFLVGAAFVIAFAKTPFNKDLPSGWIKGILIGLYIFFLLITILIRIVEDIL